MFGTWVRIPAKSRRTRKFSHHRLMQGPNYVVCVERISRVYATESVDFTLDEGKEGTGCIILATKERKGKASGTAEGRRKKKTVWPVRPRVTRPKTTPVCRTSVDGNTQINTHCVFNPESISVSPDKAPLARSYIMAFKSIFCFQPN